MSITFNADEIFEMAEEIERTGARFYREAAGIVKNPETKQCFLDMSAMETTHEAIFAEMRKGLAAAEKELQTFDPHDEATLYLQAMADAHGLEGKVGPDQKFTGKESIPEIFNIALNAEKTSVCFYVGLKELVPSPAGKEQIDRIIKEELSHITLLQKNLQAV